MNKTKTKQPLHKKGAHTQLDKCNKKRRLATLDTPHHSRQPEKKENPENISTNTPTQDPKSSAYSKRQQTPTDIT